MGNLRAYICSQCALTLRVFCAYQIHFQVRLCSRWQSVKQISKILTDKFAFVGNELRPAGYCWENSQVVVCQVQNAHLPVVPPLQMFSSDRAKRTMRQNCMSDPSKLHIRGRQRQKPLRETLEKQETEILSL